VNTKPPRIPYRETISARAEGHHRHKKQTGGAGQFGEVFLKVEPLPRGGGFEVVDQVKGGTIPGQFMPAVEKGVRQVLEAEDPTFKVKYGAETVVSGLGDLHMRYVMDRLQAQYHVEVNTKPPRIPYRETISARAEGHHRHKKQTGGAGQFGEVFLKVEPLPRGAGFEFVDQVKGGVIPGQFMPAVEKGVRQVLDQGPIAGYPVQDVRVIVYDGKHHPVDSKEVAFKTAGKMAFKDAVLKSKPVLLEPIVNMEVTVPEDKMGTITGDLSGKRGRIHGQDFVGGGMAIVKAQAPLSEVMQYQSQLKSVTGGQGSFIMELSHYEPVPPQVQQHVVAQYKPKAEEE
jgi:elongation factor G